MRRFFFRPTAFKLLTSFFAALATFYYSSLQTTLPEEITKAGFLVKIGATAAHIAIGPTNPILKFAVLFVFWFIVSWVVYLVVWVLEFVYVKAYNYFVIKVKYTNR